LVKDTVIALGNLATAWRSQFIAPVVAVTGSNGKTTIKEMIAAILVAKVGNTQAVHATVGNFNNHIGLPLTLLKMQAEHEYAVLEMGMSHLGEINYLTQIAKPNVAVIGNAGTAHIGEVGSRDNIAQAKGEIFAGLASNGVAVINADDAYADYWKGLNVNRTVLTFGLNSNADVRAEVQYGLNGQQSVRLLTPQGEISFNFNVLGEHNVRNALAASAVAVALNIPLSAIAAGLESFVGVKGRLTQLQGINRSLVIDDTYNANPDSMRAAIDVLVKQGGTKLMVMGDMGELGEDAPQLHAEIGTYAKQKGVDQFYTLGENSKAAAVAYGQHAESFNEVSDLVNVLKNSMNQNTVVLVKGSRFMKMEQVVNEIVQHMTAENKGAAH
jgi:UDP-N-acetylmuramoyl-tripeptide--D-alanyl-D-alanine ligase